VTSTNLDTEPTHASLWRKPWTRLSGLIFLLISLLMLPAALPATGLWPAVILIALTTMIAPAYGFALGIFIAPFQQFGVLGVDQFHLLKGICWSLIAIRLLTTTRKPDFASLTSSPITIFLAAFVLLVAVHNALPFTSRYYILDVGFVTTICVITGTLAASNRLSLEVLTLTIISIFASVIFSAAFDYVLIYLPLPEISPLGSGLPTDKLRLGGLHANPNATAKFILAAICLLSGRLMLASKAPNYGSVSLQWSLLCILGLSLAATAAKSAIIAFIAALSITCLISLFVQSPPRSIRYRPNKFYVIAIVKVLCLFALLIVVWVTAIAPPIKRHAAKAWLETGRLVSRPDLEEIAGINKVSDKSKANIEASKKGAAASGGSSVSDAFINELRIGKSFQLNAEVAPGSSLESPLKSDLRREKATERDCGLMCTGQRDLLWSAGWSTVREHWLWGIGYGGWKAALDKKLGYPFDSPHIGLLEIWGEFGLAGAFLYLGFIMFVLHRMWVILRIEANRGHKAFMIGCSLFAVSIMITELFEPQKFFAMAPHSIWIWSLLALQERLLKLRSSTIQL
jgi:hypothetical protein